MEKLSEILESFRRRFRKDDAPEENFSMADGVDDTVYGINRKVVYSIIGVIVVAFISFSYFSSSDTEQQKVPRTKQEEPANKNQMEHKAGMPNDYAQMQQMNAKKTGQTQPAPQTSPHVAAAQNQNPQQPQQLPQIPQRNYSSAYVPTASAPVQAPPVPSPVAEKEKYAAAISFNMAAKEKKQAAAGTSESQMLAPTSAGSQVSAATMMASSPAYVPLTQNSLQAGTVFPAVLLTGINTDIGGQVIAQIESNVYDSLSGSMLLIPAGSRLIGTYGNDIRNGQGRVSVTWDALVLPTGGSYALNGSMIAADYAGYAGISGKVNNHTGGAIRAGVITSAIAALGAIATGSNDTRAGTYTTGQLAQQGAMSNLINSASSIFNQSLKQNLQPTITVKAGSEFNVYVTQTIQLSPYTFY